MAKHNHMTEDAFALWLITMQQDLHRKQDEASAKLNQVQKDFKYTKYKNQLKLGEDIAKNPQLQATSNFNSGNMKVASGNMNLYSIPKGAQ